MMEQWLKPNNPRVWIKCSGINFYYFSMNILIGTRDDNAFMAIMAFPNKGLAFFDFEKPLKAQNTSSWNSPCMSTKCALATDSFKRVPHDDQPGFIKGGAMLESLPALSNRC